jgi:hypothetical protein
MIPSLFTAGSLIAPSGALISSGYVAGATLGAQHFNWMWNHLTVELNNLLVAGGVSQNSAVDTQVRDSILALIYANGGQAYLHINSGSPYSLSLSPLIGTLEVTTGATTFGVVLPSAAAAYAIGYEVDIRKDDAGDGVGTTNKVRVTCQSGDYIANILNGSWDVTEQYGHVKLRAVKIGANYNWAVVSAEGTIYRSVLTSNQSQATPTQNQWYNIGGSIASLTGVYEASISGTGGNGSGGKRSLVTLSTGNATQSDADLTAELSTASGGQTIFPFFRRKRIVLSAQSLYMNMSSPDSSSGSLILMAGTGSSADGGNIIIEAKRVA